VVVSVGGELYARAQILFSALPLPIRMKNRRFLLDYISRPERTASLGCLRQRNFRVKDGACPALVGGRPCRYPDMSVCEAGRRGLGGTPVGHRATERQPGRLISRRTGCSDDNIYSIVPE